MTFCAPASQCPLCPRLAAFREANQTAYPLFHNGAVAAFGDLSAEMLIVGLAPGLKGANATGRPFTGDYAGDVLYESLQKCGLAQGNYDKRADDGLRLHHVRITNAVRCVPPENKPVGDEIKQCNGFLTQEIAAMPKLKVILSLGGISHKAVLTALGYKQSAFKFSHGGEHLLRHCEEAAPTKQSMQSGLPRKPFGLPRNDELVLLNSYHCSRYNINTNRLTQEMFDTVMMRAKALLK